MGNEPLKHVQNHDDVSVAMKLEAYPNRDSTVFMDRMGMGNCHTFIRGTYRFEGFSSIISCFHDVGLTSDDPVGDGVKNLKELCHWRFSIVPGKPLTGAKKALCAKLTNGMETNDRLLVEGMLSRTDYRHYGGNQVLEEKAIRSIVKTLHFLKVFDSKTTLKVANNKGNRRSCLDAFGDILGVALKHTD